MKKKKCIAMLLAGGQGSRLGRLTTNIAKPAVSFGGKYRIIDFGLSNCVNSGIDTVGILVQYKPLVLNRYVGTGESWDMAVADGGVHILPPYAGETGGQWYEGTADAIYHNIDFIDMYEPENVLILSGDHIYKMDYKIMLDEHEKNGSDLTVSVIEVPWEEASRFGIMTADDQGNILKFSENIRELFEEAKLEYMDDCVELIASKVISSDRDRFVAVINQVFDGNLDRFAFEVRIRNQNDKVMPTVGRMGSWREISLVTRLT